jgi:hypothetical protein
MYEALRRVCRGAFDSTESGERARAAQRVSRELPPEVRAIRHQWLGAGATPCAATHSVHEACDFSCTACYLTETANQTPPLPFELVADQLDQIRAFTGPAGNVQLTSGEVTLLPAAELARIVRYARAIGLDPMVMTHGETFNRDSAYLPTLMEAGLEKVGIHVDTTQRGRSGYGKDATEDDLMAVRDRFAELIRTTRKTTGRPLKAAHTFTVTEGNLHAVTKVTRWLVENADAFRMVSFQPTADVGRTRVGSVDGSTEVWDRVCEGIGHSMNPHTFVMGHPDCNSVCLAFVVRFGDEVRVMEVKREHATVDHLFFDRLCTGAFMGFYTDGVDRAELLGRVLRLFGRSPEYLWQWPAYGAYRLWDGNMGWLPRFFRALLTGKECRIDPIVIVVHNFMSRHELHTEVGQDRLAACSFKVPVDGRMVSMCELNGTELRHDLNRALQKRGESLPLWSGA